MGALPSRPTLRYTGGTPSSGVRPSPHQPSEYLPNFAGTGELLDASSTNSTTSSASTSASAVVAAVSTTSSTSSSASGMTIYTTLSSSTASASASGSVSASASASAAASLAKGSKASALASGAGRSVQFSFGGVIVGGLLGYCWCDLRSNGQSSAIS